MIALIAACAENGVIGNQGRIPWKIKGEQIRFRKLTMGNVVVMGRRTFEEIGTPLPGRDTVVVSATKRYEGGHCLTRSSFEKAMEAAQTIAGDRDIFICGGAGLYRAALPFVERMYLTEIHAEFDGDVVFPAFHAEEFVKKTEVSVEGDLPYDYVIYTRKTLYDRAVLCYDSRHE